MKTITVGSNNTTRTIAALSVMAGLGAIYLYQRRGGSITELLGRGFKGLMSARDRLGQIAPSMEDKAPSLSPSA